MRDIRLPNWSSDLRNQIEFVDDFFWYISPHFWTNLAADAGVTAPAQSDAANGVVTGATGATDNNEILVRSTNEVFLFAADAGFIFESRVKYTEANTDDANVAVGLADAAGANLLLDDGGGASIANSGVLIYKVDGGTVWKVTSKNGSSTTTTTSDQTAGGGSYQNLRIIGRPVDGTNYELTFFLDGLPLTDNVYHRPIKHVVAYASATEMRLVACYLKAGGANSETFYLDTCAFAAVRV